jgi:hypothetical protein
MAVTLKNVYVRFEVFTPFLKNDVSGMLRCVALIRTEVSEEHIASIIKVKRIIDLGTTLTVTKNCNYIPPKRRFLQQSYRVTFQKTAFFIVTAVNTST